MAYCTVESLGLTGLARGLLQLQSPHLNAVPVAALARECRWWSTHVDYFQSKEHFLRYAERYARQPPIAQHRFEEITDAKVRFSLKDKKLKMRVCREIGDMLVTETSLLLETFADSVVQLRWQVAIQTAQRKRIFVRNSV